MNGPWSSNVYSSLYSTTLPSNTMALIGDSRLASWRSLSATITERNPKGYFSFAQAYSGERFTVVSDQSVGGSQMAAAGVGTQISTTQLDAALASGAGHLLVDGGVNDFFQAGATLATVKAAMTTILNAALLKGMRVWVIVPPGVNAAYGSYSVSAQSKMMAYQDWLRSLVSTQYAKAGVYVVDLAAVVIAPTSATGDWKTNYAYDNIHPRNLGAMVMGAELARMWSLYVPEVPRLLTSAADNWTYSTNTTNILDNGLMTAGATLATGFTSQTTGTGATTDSLVSRADGYGNDQQRVITFGANNDSVRMFTSDVKARVSNGDKLVMAVEVNLSAPTNLRCIRAQLTLTGASSSLTATTMQLDATNDMAFTTTTKQTLVTNLITVDTGVLGALSSVQGNLAAFGSGAGGVTLKIGRWSIRKVTQ